MLCACMVASSFLASHDRHVGDTPAAGRGSLMSLRTSGFLFVRGAMDRQLRILERAVMGVDSTGGTGQ